MTKTKTTKTKKNYLFNKQVEYDRPGEGSAEQDYKLFLTCSD